MLPTDTIVYVAAGALVTMPDRPIQGREYRVKVVSGTAETTAVQVFAPKGRSIEDPSAGSQYTFRSGATPATITTSGACYGWRFDGAAMNISIGRPDPTLLNSNQTLTMQQGGTLGAPQPEHFFSVQPTDPAKAPYSLFIGGATFNGQFDTVFYLGYNADHANVSEPICTLNMEQNFETVPGTFFVECYFETGISSASLVRPIGYVLNRSTGSVTTTLSYTSPSFFAIQGGAAGATQQMRWTDGQCFIAPTAYSIQSNNGLTLANLAGTLTLQNAAGQFNVWALGAGSQLYTAADSWAFSDHTTAQHATMDFVGSVARFYPSTDNQGSLGISGGRWASVSAVAGNFSTLTGGGVALASSVGTINVAAGGTFTPAAAVYQNPYITLTGSLAANVTVVLPATAGATWIIDATACTLNAHTITLQANGVNWATTVGVTNLYEVTYGGAGKLYGVALTP
jgi:hypothetical protein